MLAVWSVSLLQGAPLRAQAPQPIGPRLPGVQRSISTRETLTIERFDWGTSSNGGPAHYDRHAELVGRRWRRTFDLVLTDVDLDLALPGSRTRRVFETAVDALTLVYGEPSTGPDLQLWSFHGWPEHLALELVKGRGAAHPQYAEEAEQPTDGLDQQRLDSLREDCALTGLARRIAEQGGGASVVHVEPELLRDLLFPGGDLVEIQFADPLDPTRESPDVWYVPWPCWGYVGRGAQFGRCTGTIALTPKVMAATLDGQRAARDTHTPTTFAVTIRVQCRADASDMARQQKLVYRNDPELMEYRDRIEMSYVLDGELVYDGDSAAIASARLSGSVSVSESMEALRSSPNHLGVSKGEGTFKASGTLENKWSTRPSY